MEELVAELGSAFLSADLDLTPEVRDDHAAYIASWISAQFSAPRRTLNARLTSCTACRSPPWRRPQLRPKRPEREPVVAMPDTLIVDALPDISRRSIGQKAANPLDGYAGAGNMTTLLPPLFSAPIMGNDKMASFEVHGPFEIVYEKRKGGRTLVFDEFWSKDAEAHHLAKERGCYVFAIRNRGLTPIYVGKATKSFKQETFSATNRHKYNNGFSEYGKARR
jgi:hypothetical protein